MEQRLERLFWLIGGALLLPFILHLGAALNPGETERQSSSPPHSGAPVYPAMSVGELPISEVSDSEQVVTQRQTEPASFRPGPGTSLGTPHYPASVPVGRLLIPQLDLSVPVFAEANQLNLEQGLALLPGSLDLDTTSTIGVVSYSDTLWQHLDELPGGSRLILQSEQELRLFFVLDNRRLEQSRGWQPASATPPSLTLICRARDGSKSQVLRAVEARSNSMGTTDEAGSGAHRLRRF